MATSPAVETVLDVALSPALWLGIALALTYGMLFYIWRGGGARQLGRDLLAGVAGFVLGQVAGSWLQLNTLALGQVQLLAGTLGAGLGLVMGRWAGRGR